MEKGMGKEMSTVALVECGRYGYKRNREAVAQGLGLLGGVKQFVRPEEKILIKPNLLRKAVPRQVITTHPAVFAAVAQELQAAGCDQLFYGDSPGVGGSGEAAKSAGIAREAERLGIQLGDYTKSAVLPFPEGRTAKEFILSQAVLDADAIIGVCKMKTHALERITGAVKNMYGCVHSVHKSAGHVAYPTAEHFASMLCDLNRALSPRLHIMDGIVAMEGNGPASGTPVRMGVLLFSSDPVALDAVFCRLVGLDPALVPTCFCGEQYGIGTYRQENIQILTPDGEISMEEAAERFGKPDFHVNRSPGQKSKAWSLAGKALKPLQQRPQIDPALCVKCGACVKSCPVEGKALDFRNGKERPPVYDYSKCIRCYCCQEMCPKKAISVKTPLLGRLLPL